MASLSELRLSLDQWLTKPTGLEYLQESLQLASAELSGSPAPGNVTNKLPDLLAKDILVGAVKGSRVDYWLEQVEKEQKQEVAAQLPQQVQQQGWPTGVTSGWGVVGNSLIMGTGSSTVRWA